MYPQQQFQQPNTQLPQPPLPPAPMMTPPQSPKKPKTKLIASIAIGLILIICGAVTAYIFTRPNDEPNTKQEVKDTTNTSSDDKTPSRPTQPVVGQMVATNCFTFSAPAEYTSSADKPACTVTLTHKKDAKTTIKISLLTSNLTLLTNDVIDYVNSRYKKMAKDGGLTVYKAGNIGLNSYQTGFLYMDSSNDKSSTRKKVYYTVLNEGQKSKATGVKLIQAFLINGYADTTSYDDDVRLVVSSFKIN